MGTARLQTGVTRRAVCGDPCSPLSRQLNSISILLSEAQTNSVRWHLDVSAQLAEGDARVTVARIVTRPRTFSVLGNAPRAARLVAVCTCPGAVQWFVDGRLYRDEAAEPLPVGLIEADLWIDGAECCGGVQAVEVLEGFVLPSSVADWDAGVGNGAPSVPGGYDVFQVTVTAGAVTDATIAIPGHATITVPKNTSLTISPGILSTTDLQVITIAGAPLSWLVMWEPA